MSRADVWWYCGGPLMGTLLENWSGTCTLVQLAIPFTLAFRPQSQTQPFRRGRDNTLAGAGGALTPQVYIDSIGVPRGVPNKFTARNQIAARFESVLFWWSTINKNVDWINYIYYNQPRFVNYRDAIKVIAKQLGPTSQKA